jgi:exosortase H (IPTLxxWG-CTERM-specific)
VTSANDDRGSHREAAKTAEGSGRGGGSKRKRIRFLVLFAILIVAFEVPLAFDPVDVHLVLPFTRVLTSVSGGILRLVGERVVVSGTTIAGACFAVDIRNGCNGLEATLFLVAATLAFPAAWRQRLIGAAAGAAAIQAINLVRIVTLYLIGCHRRSWFDAFHLAVWQTIVFACAVLLFAAWSRRVTLADARSRA